MVNKSSCPCLVSFLIDNLHWQSSPETFTQICYTWSFAPSHKDYNYNEGNCNNLPHYLGYILALYIASIVVALVHPL